MVVRLKNYTDSVVKIEGLLAKKQFIEAYHELESVDQSGLYLNYEYALLNRWYTLLLESETLSETQSLDVEAKLGRVMFRLEDRVGAKAVLSSIIGRDFPLKLFAMSVLGAVLIEDGEYQEAEKLLTQTITMAKLKKEQLIEAVSKVRLARVFVHKTEYKIAESLINEAITIAKKQKWERDLKIWEGHLFDLYLLQGKEIDIDRVSELMQYFSNRGDTRYLNESRVRFEKAKVLLSK